MSWDWDEFFERLFGIVVGVLIGAAVLGVLLTFSAALWQMGLGWIPLAILALVIIAAIIAAATMIIPDFLESQRYARERAQREQARTRTPEPAPKKRRVSIRKAK